MTKSPIKGDVGPTTDATDFLDSTAYADLIEDRDLTDRLNELAELDYIGTQIGRRGDRKK